MRLVAAVKESCVAEIRSDGRIGKILGGASVTGRATAGPNRRQYLGQKGLVASFALQLVIVINVPTQSSATYAPLTSESITNSPNIHAQLLQRHIPHLHRVLPPFQRSCPHIIAPDALPFHIHLIAGLVSQQNATTTAITARVCARPRR